MHVVASLHRHTLRQQERLRAAFTADEVLSVSKLPTTAPSKCETSSIKPPPPKADSWPLVFSRAYQRVSPAKSLAWAEPLRKWKDAFLAYFDTAGASNGPTEAINGIIEMGRRTARVFRNLTNYRLRMLLIAGGLDTSTATQL